MYTINHKWQAFVVDRRFYLLWPLCRLFSLFFFLLGGLFGSGLLGGLFLAFSGFALGFLLGSLLLSIFALSTTTLMALSRMICVRTDMASRYFLSSPTSMLYFSARSLYCFSTSSSVASSFSSLIMAFTARSMRT